MLASRRRLAALLLAPLILACASTPGGSRVDRDVLTREQMQEGHYTTLYDAVLALRANWLRPRGPDSFVSPTQVWVYFNDVRLGGVETLRQLQPSAVATVRHFDGVEAQGRWGVGHGAGVILVSTWSDGRRDSTPPPAADGDDASYVSPDAGPRRAARGAPSVSEHP